MSKQVILTGLRANNDLHIGNYLGALLPMVDMAKQRSDEHQVNLFVPDLHSFTTPIDHSQLQAGIMQNLRVFVAAGLPLDNPNVHIYRQSYIPAHSELTWILDCFTGIGEMNRMTQLKDKSKLSNEEAVTELSRILDAKPELWDILGKGIYGENDSKGKDVLARFNKYAAEYLRHLEANRALRSSVGLLNYPVLMAADIVLYDSLYVPVGDDQTQHLEFTRDIAERMNAQFGELFVVPKPVKEQHKFFGKDQGLRIKDLADPTKKMSKSDATGKGVIFMTDTPQVASKKIMSATTDSVGQINYNKDKQPGIANLLDILKLLGGNPEEFIGQAQYGPLKTAVAEVVSEFLKDFQIQLAQVDDAAILAKLAASETAMNQQANAKLLKVQRAVGLR